MPIIEIHGLPPDRGLDVPAALAEVTGAVAAYLGEEPRGTWAIWRPVEPGAYAEGADVPPRSPAERIPRSSTCSPVADDTPALLRAVGRAVVEAFGLDDGNVVVRLTEAEPGRVYWGD
jgi:phenylpyruvate tautomerase PptA (4-oxalocrotonate tautomerase family)